MISVAFLHKQECLKFNQPTTKSLALDIFANNILVKLILLQHIRFISTNFQVAEKYKALPFSRSLHQESLLILTTSVAQTKLLIATLPFLEYLQSEI